MRNSRRTSSSGASDASGATHCHEAGRCRCRLGSPRWTINSRTAPAAEGKITAGPRTAQQPAHDDRGRLPWLGNSPKSESAGFPTRWGSPAGPALATVEHETRGRSDHVSRSRRSFNVVPLNGPQVNGRPRSPGEDVISMRAGPARRCTSVGRAHPKKCSLLFFGDVLNAPHAATSTASTTQLPISQPVAAGHVCERGGGNFLGFLNPPFVGET